MSKFHEDLILCHLCGLLMSEESHVSGCGKQMQFTCDICETKFTTIKHLRRHINIHSKTTFACLLCDKKFSRKDNLKEHTENVHENSNFINCFVCNGKFKRLKDFKRHKKLHLS